MIVTTTNSIEGREISRYNDPIAANVVIGTNIFSDIAASYLDFFNRRSTSYEKKMQEMFKPSHLFQWKFGKFRANTTLKDAPVISLSI
ncbi:MULTISPECIES: heavy metal-binding domain-containing protein [unclassified Sphingobacterium]|uniref:heavy metal-binding domain-containing protein n=1 Tax=unclassified Sphingobacterium TaxID=2609468 RepID=UPI0025F2760B|nr:MULTISPECIES: heavy metal-binding domain-containing protein [unclassified Sphingobacterium]